MDQPSLKFSNDFLTLSTLLACTAACDSIIMHYVKKYLLSPPNLTRDNFSGCPVVFVWCDAVNNHYLVTSLAPFIVCNLLHLSSSNLKTPHLFGILLYRNCSLPWTILTAFISAFWLLPTLRWKDQTAWKGSSSMDKFLSKKPMRIDYYLALIFFWRGKTLR